MLIAYIKYHPESLNRPIMQENKMSQSKINVEFIEEPTQTFSEREENKEPEQGIASADLKKRFFAVKDLGNSLSAGLRFVVAISFAIIFFVLFMASLDWLDRYDLSLSNPRFDIRFIIPIAMILSSLVAVYVAIGDMVRMIKANRTK